MALINQLSREDVMFVAGETESIYQHVAVLSVLDCSDRPEFDFDHFRQHCIDRVSLIPHFRWKLHEVPMGLDRPYWIEDDHFRFEHHIKRIALPAPGDNGTLCEVAAHLYSRHLDRSKPLWEMWLIEGLEGGKYAYLQKFHHCMMDGEGAFKMIEIICDSDPDTPPDKKIDQTISEARAGNVPTYQQRSSKAMWHLARLPGEAARSVYDILRPKILEQFVWPKKPREERPIVPTACFNGVIGSDRAMAFASLSLTEIKAIKTHFGVSLNDVVLALVSGAIRNYLLEFDELPEESLRTNIAVSLRTDDDAQLSNKVTTTTVTLATDLEDPVERLQAINTEAEQSKLQARSGAKGVVEMFQMMPPVLISTVMDSLPAEQAPQILGANVIVSNVRGSPAPMYIAGARMETMYPMSILTAGMGINFTCISYLDKFDFGIIVDPDLLPEHQVIATELQAALTEFLALCKPKRKAEKKSVSRKKPAARRKSTVKKTTRNTTASKKPKTSRKSAKAKAKARK